jgi:hypothetical protein
MVFTVPVRNRKGYPRRTVLAAGAAAVMGGCALLAEPGRWEPGGALDAVRADALSLADRYDALIAARPDLASRLTPLRDAHLAHAAARAQELGSVGGPVLPRPSTSTAPAPTTTSGAEALAGLAAAERATADRAAAACMAAPGWRAPLLGSIAACRASHAEALA